MSDSDWPGQPDPDLPTATVISVTGTVDRPHDQVTALDVKSFRIWLLKRHPGARVAILLKDEPTGLGRAQVHFVSAPLRAESGGLPIAEQARRISIEQDLIASVWRKMVSWKQR